MEKREEFLPNITYRFVQEEHPNSPSYVYINNEWLGSLKNRETTFEVMKMIQNSYLAGIEAGKEARSKEIRRLL